MLKYFVPLCFLLATVSGQLQNQLQRGQLLSPVDQPKASQSVSTGHTLSANLKPCRRRNNNVENPEVLPPDAGWVQILRSQTVLPLDQKISREAVEQQGTPQPLSENTISVQQGNNIQKDIDSNRTIEENEIPLILKNDDIDDLVDNHDELCHRSEDVDNDTEGVDEHNNLFADSRDGSDEVHKQALELLSKCVQKEQTANADESEGNTRRSINDLNAIKPAENGNANEPPKINEEKEKRKFRNRKLNANEVQLQLKNPAQGEGISNIADSKVLLLQNSRVCYACTTVNDPSCWNPDQTTTVKYCKKEDDACITKTFKAKNELIMTRDCGNSCTESDFPGVPLRYKSCRICHSDQCNGAGALNTFNMLLVAFIISAIKFTF